MAMRLNTDLDIRDIETGETYFVVADSRNGGRCVMNGMFIAAWKDKGLAKSYASSDKINLVVVKQVRS